MSAQIDTATDSLIAANQNKSKPKQNDGSGTADVFASLIQGQLPSNIVFSRMDSKLDLPQKSASPDFEDPLAADKKSSSPAERKEDNAATDNNGDDYDDNDYNNASADQPQESSHVATESSDLGLIPAQETTQTAQTANTAATQAQQKPPTGQADVNKAAAASTQNTAATKGAVNIENMDMVDAPDVEAGPLSRQSGKGQNNIPASVTNKSEEMSSQPNTTLAASAAVAAQSTKEVQTGGDVKTATTLDKPASDIEGAVNNAFTKGQNQKNDSNSQQGSAQNNGLKNGAEVAQGNAGDAAQQNVNFNNALNSVSSAPAPLNSASQIASSQPTSVEPISAPSGTNGPNNQVQNKQATTPTPQAKPTVPPRIISDQIAVNIQRAVGAGMDTINIQLRPNDLGRIDVTMEMGKDGRMTAVINVEKPETLDMLKSDAKGLIQSLNDAGLQTDANSLSFNLQSGNEDGSQFASGGNGKDKEGETEFSLDGEDTSGEADNYLAEGEKAQLDENGHLNVQV